ncbi:hypothetical protein ID854_15305 [Xenorhabdus sp. M]|uniref:Uncharacterized protein n=1 Tax=Xenorhabdus szentirmaii TaxID=290112 RepID=A0AAW3YUD0_9GAMM|nr:hypothetical protein [Xenorhabdus sp. M]MBD2801770.1 hypothetical protein [Xenorhabdus sp. M]
MKSAAKYPAFFPDFTYTPPSLLTKINPLFITNVTVSDRQQQKPTVIIPVMMMTEHDNITSDRHALPAFLHPNFA